MPRKETKKRKRAPSSAKESVSSTDEQGKRGGALSKFKEFDVSELLQKPQEVPEIQPVVEEQPCSPCDEVVVDPPPLTATDTVEATSEEPVAPIPQLIPPEPLKDLPPDEEFVPLPTIQVVPMMNRALEAQSGLLKEPAPPASIQRVTQPGALPPAMPTALMELLSG
ncbi:hypothetical protein TCDM_14019 [Trypanosoma cruzi Dm28c]|uniref:Uncharacterized protein n=2 Tax=Trypanosoma cruzi TaxID=5693 RepID=V5B4H1_TRYCR|nr:hypothetical protein TCDM_14019 [Trypanosoma cruzi Dm28c]KAF8288060.1 hypothetical protein TcBrA4_0016640 [Trypanosoma cruzi]PBJ75672.1 hypothetical protein BCY84_10830 [Trypanosoma cruzi cruzi]PWU90756.1 hypothetical protein C4B63_48g136 [Trypanosoma cruzi]